MFEQRSGFLISQSEQMEQNVFLDFLGVVTDYTPAFFQAGMLTNKSLAILSAACSLKPCDS